jgi:uncharacterized phiE125 gp8 family phage protein
MNLISLTPPAQLAVSLAEAKQYCRVDHSDEDALFTDLIRAASQRLEGRDGILGRCLINQTWRLVLDGFAASIALPLPPCQSITSITYIDAAGISRTLAPSDYQAIGLGGVSGATLFPAYGKAWPSTNGQPETVTVDFVAGYGANATDIPEPIRMNILAYVASCYDNREAAPELSDDGTIRAFKVWVF